MHKIYFEERLTMRLNRNKQQNTHIARAQLLLVTLRYICNYYKSKNPRFTPFFVWAMSIREKTRKKKRKKQIQFNEPSRAFISTVSLVWHKFSSPIWFLKKKSFLHYFFVFVVLRFEYVCCLVFCSLSRSIFNSFYWNWYLFWFVHRAIGGWRAVKRLVKKVIFHQIMWPN